MPATRCYILGAGFSKCCDLPLASELTLMSWRSLAKKDPTDTTDEPALRKRDDFGYEILDADLQLIKLLFPSHACATEQPDSWPDFEQLITALDEARRLQASHCEVAGCSADHAKHWLMHHMQQRLSELTGKAALCGLDTIKTFVQRVDTERAAVISFNWDVLLEIAAGELDMPVLYKDDERRGLCLTKPHGSLNLVDLPVVDYKDAKHSINVHSLDVELEYSDGESRVVLRTAHAKDAWIRQAWAKERLLVEPNMRKAYDNHWIKLQWVRALEMVRRAEEIVVIGFSLPVADLRPRILLQLARASRQPPPRLILVDPKADSLRSHYRDLTGFDAHPFCGTLAAWLSHPEIDS